jgi:2-isopropylmalate synthase
MVETVSSPRLVTIFDTTLRDGEQAPLNAMDVQSKVEIFKSLDHAGIDVVESGFPAASQIDFEAVVQILRLPRRAKVCVLARTNYADIDRCLEALGDAENVQVQVLVTGSEIHLEHKRQITREQAMVEMETAVAYLTDKGVEVALAIEDASRGSHGLVVETIERGVRGGVSAVCLGDTVGVAIPYSFEPLVKAARAAAQGIKLAIHCHNDLGLATANTITGLMAGADEFQGCLCGIGERAGNVAIEEVAAILLTQGEALGLRCDINAPALHDACLQLSAAISFPIARNKAILGKYVYSTAAGIHQSGMNRDHSTYEPFDPAIFGRDRGIVISRHSGRAAIQHLAQTFGLAVSDQVVCEAYEEILSDPQPEQFNERDKLATLFDRVKERA